MISSGTQLEIKHLDRIYRRNGEHFVNTEAPKLTQSAALWIKKGEMTWTDLSFFVRNYIKYNYMRIDRLINPFTAMGDLKDFTRQRGKTWPRKGCKNESPRFTSRLFVRLCSTIPRFTSRRFCSVHMCTFCKSSPVQSSPVQSSPVQSSPVQSSPVHFFIFRT